jgi:prophage tail gpP-like protein
MDLTPWPRPRPVIPKPEETASILIGNRVWQDWTSVSVTHRCEAWPLFAFSAVERSGAYQIRPGDECAIYLGGVLAVTGVITVRQVAYDANNHGIQIQGKGITSFAAEGSIIDDTGDHDGESFEEAARKIVAPFGVGIKTIGKLNDTPFARLQVEPGEKCWDCLERLARPRGVVLGSDHLGNFLLIGENKSPVVAELVEGVNIEKMQAIVTTEGVHSEYLLRAQRPATDESHGAEANQQEAKVPGTARRYSPLLTTAEQPVWGQGEVQDRARNESIWHEGAVCVANIGVQGWLRGPRELWRIVSNVHVRSPMAMLDEVMTIQTVTFTQENGAGTMTNLECVPPFLLRSSSDYNLGRTGVAQDPASYETTAKPAAAMTAVPEPPPLLLPIPV